MRASAIILVAALLVIGPGALAGGANVTYMETTSSCDDDRGGNSTSQEGPTYIAIDDGENGTEGNDSSSSGQSGSGHWSYQESESCEEETTYVAATASDDEGELASADASARSWDQDARSYDAWYSWYDDPSTGESWHRQKSSSSQDRSDGWERSVSASTTVADAEASRGCSSGYHEDEYSEGYGYSEPNRSYHSSDGWSSWSSHDRCHDTVTVDHGDRDATVGWVSGCQATGSSYSSFDERSDHDAHWRDYGSTSTSDRTCRDGAMVDSPAGEAFAGWASTCQRTHSSDSHHAWEGDEHQGYGWSTEEARCFDGVLVEGPTDLSTRAGLRSSSYESCEWSESSDDGTAGNSTDGNETDGGSETSCWSDRDERVGFETDWEASPTGPLHLGMWRSLPGPGWE